LSAQDLRAAAEVHRELGPEYSDAVVDSFFEKVDNEIQARVDARLADLTPGRGRTPSRVNSDQRRSLLIGVAIGGGVSGVLFTLITYFVAPNWLHGDQFDAMAAIAWIGVIIAYLGFCVAMLARKRRDRD